MSLPSSSNLQHYVPLWEIQSAAVDVGGNTTGLEGDARKDHMVVDEQDEGNSVGLEKGHRQPYRYKFIDVIEVSVGSQSFQAHQNVIFERSASFKAAASEAWNAERRAIKLAQEEPITFDRYLKCLYHGDPEVSGTEFDHNPLVKTYVLVDKPGDPTSCNLIIDSFIEIIRKGPLPSLDCVNKTFEWLPTGSPLRMLMVDCYVWEGDENVLDVEDGEEWSNEFLHEVSKEFLKASIKNTKNVRTGVFARQNFNMCHYHQHSKSHPACAGARKARSDNDGIVDWCRG